MFRTYTMVGSYVSLIWASHSPFLPLLVYLTCVIIHDVLFSMHVSRFHHGLQYPLRVHTFFKWYVLHLRCILPWREVTIGDIQSTVPFVLPGGPRLQLPFRELPLEYLVDLLTRFHALFERCCPVTCDRYALTEEPIFPSACPDVSRVTITRYLFLGPLTLVSPELAAGLFQLGFLE